MLCLLDPLCRIPAAFRMTVVFLFLPPVLYARAAEVDVNPDIWDGIIPNLEEVRVLEDRHKDLPRWAVFRTDRGDNQERIEALLDEVTEILAISPVQGLRVELAAMQERNAEDEAKISALRERRISAPEDALIGETVKRIDNQMVKLRESIRGRDSEIRDAKTRFAKEVKASGIDLSRDQLDFLLSTVVGDTVIDIGIAFQNVKNITGQLEALTGESLENMETARRYYGMYTVLLKALAAIYDSAISEIDQLYIPEIDDIDTRTRVLITKTRSLLEGAAEEHLEALGGNVAAQEFTLEAATLYRDYLVQQRGGLDQARDKLRENLSVAQNTYETVKISGDLLRVMNSSEDLFELLFELQVPTLRPFENLEVKREFEKLTTQLRRSE